MHYSALNAVSAASPASASPSSSSLSSLSPVGHSHYHHLSSNEQQHSQASHHNSHSHDQLIASMSEGSSSISSSPYNTSGASSVTSTVIKTENMCDDLATYTTLQSSAPNTQQHYGNNDHHMTSSGQTAGPGNAAANTSSAGPKAGSKRSAPSSTTTATKSTYNGNSSSGGGNKSSGANSNGATPTGRTNPGGGKKTKGRVKIKMEFIDNKLRRYTTFSKRKTGIMKKAYELSTLTGTQVMLLVASETGHVYTFATRKLQPMITSDAGKALIQTCLNSPDPSGLMNGSAGSGSAASNTTGPDVVTTNGHVSTLVGGNNSGPVANSHSQLGQQQADGQHHNSDLSRMLSAGPGSLSGCSTPNTVEQRMSATGFEETELSYSVNGDDCSPLNEKQHLYHASPAPSSASSLSSASSSCAASSPPILLSMSAASGAAADHNGNSSSNGLSNGYEAQQQQPGQHEMQSSAHGHHHHQFGGGPYGGHNGLGHAGSHSVNHHSQQQQQQFTTLNSAVTMANGGGMLSNGHSGHIPPHHLAMSTSTVVTPTSVSSFFNSFGSGSGNSPPPLTPNGLLSGLHSFLFADSSTLGLDSFVDCVGPVGSDVSCLLPPPVSSVNAYLGSSQSNGPGAVPPSSTSPVTLAGLNSASPVGPNGGPNQNNQIRLPPFCTI